MGEPGGATLWNGTAFNCAIILLHHYYLSTDGAIGSCNNGTIVGRSLSVEGNNYTSQLNVTVTSDTAGETIMCFHYNGNDNGYNFTLQFSIATPITGLSHYKTNQSHVVL